MLYEISEKTRKLEREGKKIIKFDLGDPDQQFPNEIIEAVMYLLLKKGDNIIIPAPYWTAYELTAKGLGIETRFLRTEMDSNWKIDVEELENLIDRRTRLLLLNNPTSKVIDKKCSLKLFRLPMIKELKSYLTKCIPP